LSSAPRKCKDGIPRRITIPVDPESGEIRNPHMKSGREALEKWSITPDNLIQDFRTWITNHCNLLTSDTLRPLDDMSYVVSTRRLTTTFQVIQVLGTRAFMVLGRRLCLFRLLEQRKGRETRILAVVDTAQGLRLMQKLRPLRRFVEPVIENALPPILKRFLKVHLVSLRGMSPEDACVVMPKSDCSPLVVFKDKTKYLSVPLEKVLRDLNDRYAELELAQMTPDLSIRTSGPVWLEVTGRGVIG